MKAVIVQIYKTLVESKLLYGLAACSLNAAQERKLDGFQARCLRTILGVGPSFESRVTNEEVRRRAACKPATKSLLQQQLVQLGKVIRSSPDSPLYAVSLHPVTRQPMVGHFVRRVGRPSREWVPTVLSAAVALCGSQAAVFQIALDEKKWRRVIQQ